MSRDRMIFVCGGGTGGHFFSGVALAETFLQNYPDYKVLFIGTKNGIEGRTTLTDPRMSISFIRAKGLKGKEILSRLLGIFYLLAGIIESVQLLFKFRPKVVFGVGGYASAPTLFAAVSFKFLGGWKIAVLEQNSSPGLVNRLFSKLGVQSFAAFESPGFEVVDLPLRAASLERVKNLRAIHWPPKQIFILGGSQGARALNRKWADLLPRLLKDFPDLKIFHQTGRDDEQNMKDFYKTQNISAEVFAFSNEMPNYYELSDLLICRSGAMTVFEAMAFQRPCVFVPFPFATDDHQRKNALAVQTESWVIDEKDFNYERLAPVLRSVSPSIPRREKAGMRSWTEIFRDQVA